MFEVGDRVVCVDAGPDEILWHYEGSVTLEPTPLVEGRVYVILAVYPPGFVFTDKDGNQADIDGLSVSVGVAAVDGLDVWEHVRFRKIIKRDISQSLAELKALANNTPALVGEPTP